MSRRIGNKTAAPYQDRIMAQIRSAIETHTPGAVFAPTGSGKSLFVGSMTEDSIALGVPLLLVHPDVELLRQNLAVMRGVAGFSTARVACFVAKGENLPVDGLLRDTFDADVILATANSLSNKLDDPDFVRGLTRFGSRRGTIGFDEGHRAAATQLAQVLAIAAEKGATGIILTATPFRQDGRDPLDPFGAAVEQDLIGAATYDEVLSTGRIVPTKFVVAATEFEDGIGTNAQSLIEEAFMGLLREHRSIEQASKAALGQFFRDDATEADRQIARLIVQTIGAIWRSRVADRRLTIFHADSVDLALALSIHLATRTMPDGHPRAGLAPRVGYVVAYDVRVYGEGEEVDLKILGWTKREARTRLLDSARTGGFDVLVNVGAISTGTDLPRADVTFIACREKGLGSAKQAAGRTERAAPGLSPPKNDNLLIDIGSTIYGIFNDIDAMRRNNPELCRLYIKSLSPAIRQQFEMWFDKDPSLPTQIARRTANVAQRHRGDEGSDEFSESTAQFELPEVADDADPVRLSRGLYGIKTSRRDPATGKYLDRLALLCDLVEMFGHQPGGSFPRWITVTYNDRSKEITTLISKDRTTARRYAAWKGIRPATPSAKTEAPANPGQGGFLGALKKNVSLKPLQPLPRFETNVEAQVGIDFLQGNRILTMLDAAADAYLRRVLGRIEFSYPLRSIVLDRPDQINQTPLEMIVAWARMRRMLIDFNPDRYRTGTDTISVVTYDPLTPPSVGRIFQTEATTYRALTRPEDTTLYTDKLREGIGTNRVIALAPDGDGSDMLRRKAGLKPRSPSDDTEREFRTLLASLWDIRGNAMERTIDATVAKNVGLSAALREGGPEAHMVYAMVCLAEGQEHVAANPTIHAIAAAAERKEAIAVRLNLGRVCASFVGAQAGPRRKAIRALERAAVFLDRRANLSIAAALSAEETKPPVTAQKDTP